MLCIFNYNPYSIVNERPIAKIDAACNHGIALSVDARDTSRFCLLRLGGADRDRTDDPLLAKQMLSQLSYSPGSPRGMLNVKC